MAHGVTLTLRKITPDRPRFVWNVTRQGQYRSPANPEKMSRAKHRNILFGRNPTGTTTPAQRREIWANYTAVVK